MKKPRLLRALLLLLSLSLILLVGCSASPQKAIVGYWDTHQEQNGMSMDMQFQFLASGTYEVTVALHLPGEIFKDTTQGSWKIEEEKFYMGVEGSFGEPAQYQITDSTLQIILESDTMTFNRSADQ